MLLVEMVFFHGIMRKAFPGPTHRRLWCGNRRLSLGFQFPSLPSHHEKNKEKKKKKQRPILSLVRPKQRPRSRVSVSH